MFQFAAVAVASLAAFASPVGAGALVQVPDAEVASWAEIGAIWCRNQVEGGRCPWIEYWGRSPDGSMKVVVAEVVDERGGMVTVAVPSLVGEGRQCVRVDPSSFQVGTTGEIRKDRADAAVRRWKAAIAREAGSVLCNTFLREEGTGIIRRHLTRNGAASDQGSDDAWSVTPMTPEPMAPFAQ